MTDDGDIRIKIDICIPASAVKMGQDFVSRIPDLREAIKEIRPLLEKASVVGELVKKFTGGRA